MQHLVRSASLVVLVFVVTAVIRMIEYWLQGGGHLAPRALTAEAPHLGEGEPLLLGKTAPERGKAAV
ncbi:hypothetical protein GA0115240_144822 [Streptomyces sp. DvalAA-14]|nr:hypothetical protein GA0115240_144822 [Streptomyces sp. DvalAA-14]